MILLLRVVLVVFAYTHFVRAIEPLPLRMRYDAEEDFGNEVAIIRKSVTDILFKWDKWDESYTTFLEPRIFSFSSTLATIDTNIKNLQERAHVWDTFQLHVSAWNEQLASLDRKMDIISKGQEKLQELYENNIVTVTSALENKVENTIKQLTHIEETLSDIKTTVQKKHFHPHESLFEEFAARGVLSSIKSFERKLDRALLTNQNVILKNRGYDDKTKLTVKCNTPKILEELLNDISSKVDVIYDNVNVNQKYISENEDYDDNLSEDNDGNSDSVIANLASLKNKPHQLTKRGAYLRPYNPYRYDESSSSQSVKNKEQFEETERKLNQQEESLQNITRTLGILSERNGSCFLTNFEPLKLLLKHNFEESTSNISLAINSYFREQRDHIASMLERVNNCENNSNSLEPTLKKTFRNDVNDNTNDESITEDSKTKIGTTETSLHDNKTTKSCEDLEYSDQTGVHFFEALTLTDEYFKGKRFCEIRNDGLWTVIQKRDNYTTQSNFNTSWNDYKIGFGNISRDFWLGNNALHILTKVQPVILRIELEDFQGNTAWAEYDEFQVLDETERFQLLVSGYSGNASDSFSSHNGSYFSTFDRKNDVAPECCPCAMSYGGGWWFHRCFESNLNGVYNKQSETNGNYRGIIWEHWLGDYSLKKSIMMIKPRGLFVQSTFRNKNAIPDYEDP